MCSLCDANIPVKPVHYQIMAFSEFILKSIDTKLLTIGEHMPEISIVSGYLVN